MKKGLLRQSFFVYIRLAVPPSEARIYELNYRRFGNCEKMYVIQK
nr:MAG TPA: hypothetical protein [Caudoviricetes sp.]